MENNEKYGIELTADTSYFKKALKEAGQYAKAFGQGVKESFNEQVQKAFKEDFAFNDRDYQKRIDYIRNRMQEIKEQIGKGGEGEDLQYLASEYNRLLEKKQKLLQYQKEYNGELEETSKTSNNISINLGNMFDRSIAKIKRFTFYLLGARSVFSLFMKYQGIYYQYNEQMQYQSELSQNAIALSLAPAFEFLGNVIAYASIGFAKFIELLTGVNVLSKVTTKGIRDYNKSLKESQSLLSGIDEITNLTLPSSTGLASQYQALNDFQKKVAEVEKWFKENKWVEDLANGLKKAWEWIGKIYNYIKDHWDVFKYIVGGVAIAGLFGGGNLGFSITVLGVTSFIGLVEAIKDYNKAKKEFDKNQKETHDLILNNFKEETEYLLNDTEEALRGVEKGTKKWYERTNDVKSQLPSILQEIINGKLKYEEYKPVIDDIIKKLEDLDGETFAPEIEFLTQLNGSNDDIELIKKYYQIGAEGIKKEKDTRTLFFQLASDKVKEVKKQLDDIFGNRNPNVNYKVTADTSKANTSLTEFLTKFGFGVVTGMKVLGTLLSFKPYAKGLDYVPYDDYPALLHKGEAVVPAKYNPTIHGMGNDYTNSLLETLVVKMDNLANRPNVFEVDGRQFAQATYSYYDSEHNRQNYVGGVVR